MKNDYIFIAQIGFLTLTFFCLTLVWFGARKIWLKMGIDRNRTNRRSLILALIFTGWLLLVSVLSLNGFLSDFSRFPPNLPMVTIPPMVTILILTFHSRFRNFLLHVPPKWLIYMQTFRVPVEIFLWLLFLANILPEQMCFEGRNLDVLTGITAPIFGWLCFGNNRKNKTLALLWNLFGLGLLMNIVATAILSLPTPMRVFMNTPDSSFITTFPTVFLPTVLVPLAYGMHFFSLRKLWLERKTDKLIKQ